MNIASLARRAGWNLADQMVSSLTNAVLSFMVARAVDAESFGGFSIAFTVFALVIGASRALSTSPLNIRFSDVPPIEARRAAAHASGTALTIGFLGGLGCVAAGLLLEGPAAQALIVMGIVLPAVTTQDSFRYAFFSRGEPKKAAINDMAWAVVQLGAVGVLLNAGVSAVGPLVLAWGVSAACAAFLAMRQAATWPSPGSVRSWLREHRDMTGYLFASFATAQGANQGAMLIIAAVGSVRANGALRGGQILLGPVTILGSAATNFFVPEFSRRRNSLSHRQLMLAAVAVSGVMCLMSFCWGLIFLLMPDSVGLFLLGDTWAATRELLVAAVVAQVLSFATTGPVVMLFAIDRASSTLLLSFLVGGLTFLGGVGGVLVGGGAGAQWGFAIANAVIVPFWYLRLRYELRRRGAKSDPADAAVDHLTDRTTVEPTVALPSRRPVHTGFMADLESAQLATTVLPRIPPRPRSGRFGEPPNRVAPGGPRRSGPVSPAPVRDDVASRRLDGRAGVPPGRSNSGVTARPGASQFPHNGLQPGPVRRPVGPGPTGRPSLNGPMRPPSARSGGPPPQYASPPPTNPVRPAPPQRPAATGRSDVPKRPTPRPRPVPPTSTGPDDSTTEIKSVGQTDGTEALPHRPSDWSHPG